MPTNTTMAAKPATTENIGRRILTMLTLPGMTNSSPTGLITSLDAALLFIAVEYGATLVALVYIDATCTRAVDTIFDIFRMLASPTLFHYPVEYLPQFIQIARSPAQVQAL